MAAQKNRNRAACSMQPQNATAHGTTFILNKGLASRHQGNVQPQRNIRARGTGTGPITGSGRVGLGARARSTAGASMGSGSSWPVAKKVANATAAAHHHHMGWRQWNVIEFMLCSHAGALE